MRSLYPVVSTLVVYVSSVFIMFFLCKEAHMAICVNLLPEFQAVPGKEKLICLPNPSTSIPPVDDRSTTANALYPGPGPTTSAESVM